MGHRFLIYIVGMMKILERYDFLNLEKMYKNMLLII